MLRDLYRRVKPHLDRLFLAFYAVEMSDDRLR
jgi:hypothetical protein